MTAVIQPSAPPPPPSASWPDQRGLPFKAEWEVNHALEHPQAILLTEAIRPVLRARYPAGTGFIGQDVGIYYTFVAEDPLRGCKSPDWYFVPNVPPILHGDLRLSYVLYREHERPLIVIEFVSGDGSEEHDATPGQGKFWAYERAIRAEYYAIWSPDAGALEVYHRENGRYQRTAPNAAGRYPIRELGVELGLWTGTVQGITQPWMRWWDANGQLIPTGREDTTLANQRTAEERQAKEQAQQRAEQERLAKDQAQQQAEQERLAKEQAQQRAEQERLAKDQAQQQAEQERLAKERLTQELDRLRALLANQGQPPTGT
jgi:hypothetical protein